MRVLYVASNPDNAVDLNLEREITELQRHLITSAGDLLFEFLPALRTEDLPRQLRERKPDVLHLAAHGASESLSLAKEGGGRVPLTAETLLAFLPLETPPRIVYLNSCNSHGIAQALVDSGRVKMAIGSTAPITNGAARNGAVAFYEGLLAGYTVAGAFDLCRRMVESMMEDSASAKLCQAVGIDPAGEIPYAVPVLVADFKAGKPTKNGRYYKIILGVSGCPSSTIQVVFSTEEEGFITGYWSLEDDLCAVVRAAPVGGEVWMTDPWEIDGGFRVFALGMKAGGGSFSLESKLSTAIENQYRGRPTGRVPATIAAAIKDLA